MSRTYKEVTRKERREGTKRCKSCYRPGLPYLESPVFVTDALRLVEEFPYSEPPKPEEEGRSLYIWALVQDGFELNANLLGFFLPFRGILGGRYTRESLSYLEQEAFFGFQRYSKTPTETQTVPKIDWHTERKWRNGRKYRDRVTSREVEDLRERTESVNSRIDHALARGNNPFRRSRFRNCRYS